MKNYVSILNPPFDKYESFFNFYLNNKNISNFTKN